MHTSEDLVSEMNRPVSRPMGRTPRPRRFAALVTAPLLLLLAGCNMIDLGLPTGAVRWEDSAVRLGVFLDMSPLPAPFEDEMEAGKVAAFTGTVDTGGSYTINDDLVCEFDLAADAEYALDLTAGVLDTYLDGFSGAYDALGDGFNESAECTYETYALFEWIIEFEVLEPVTMQVVATLYAEVVPPVAGQSLHYILVREVGATTPVWIGESEEEEADEAFDEAVELEPGSYEFAVYARPRLEGSSGIASLASGWIYDVTFDAD